MGSIQAVFKQYEKLTVRSGLELNADKTEILSLSTDVPLDFDVTYLGKNVHITTLNRVKVC